MKKIKGFVAVAITLCIFAFTMAACSDDEEIQVEPLTADSVKGDFNGTLSVGQGEPLAIMAAVDDKISISDFPVDSIVKIVVPESDFEEAMASLPSQEYIIGYTAEIFGLNMFIEMELPVLAFEIEYGGAIHDVNVVFYTTKRGNYNGMSNSMTFELLLKSITSDGEDVHIPSSLKYNFNLSKK